MDKKILDQLNIAFEALQEKQSNSPEKIIEGYIKKYEFALNIASSNNKRELANALVSLKGLARGYLEVSSNYSQNFLHEMDKLESLLKNQ